MARPELHRPAYGRWRTLRSRVAPAAKATLMRAGGYSVVRRVLPSRRAAILRYHAVCGAAGHSYADPAICVTPKAFERHVAYLASHYAVLPLDAIVERLRTDRPLPANCVAITFDDGYRDNLEAARLLHRHGLTATFFITAGCLAGGEPFWPAELRGLVQAIDGHVDLDIAGRPLRIACTSPGDRQSAVRTLTRLFKSHTIPVREATREQLRCVAGRPDLPSPMLTWDELREMCRLGMTVGAHTMTHPNLPSAGLEAARLEIAESRTRLDSELVRSVRCFSYPNGGAECSYTPEIKAAVRAAGFGAAFTSKNGFADHKSDPYAFERIQVSERLEDLGFALEVERFAFGGPQ